MMDLVNADTHYPVEVSGWDTEHNFFVEKTTLEWSEAGGRTILLRRRITHGALVFVRLAGSLQTAFPLPYLVKESESKGSRGLHRVELEQMRGNVTPARERLVGHVG
jgi:hypothetical protein